MTSHAARLRWALSLASRPLPACPLLVSAQPRRRQRDAQPLSRHARPRRPVRGAAAASPSPTPSPASRPATISATSSPAPSPFHLPPLPRMRGARTRRLLLTCSSAVPFCPATAADTRSDDASPPASPPPPLRRCLWLIHVLPFSSSVIGQRLLKTIEIVWCGDLRVVFPLLDTNNTMSHQEQQQKPPGAIITMVNFPNLKHIHLHELPMLESICGLGRMYAPQLQTIKIRGCWSLRHLPAVRSNRSNNKVECDCEKEWWDRLEWDGLDGKHHPSLYWSIHSQYYKKKLLRGSVLI